MDLVEREASHRWFFVLSEFNNYYSYFENIKNMLCNIKINRGPIIFPFASAEYGMQLFSYTTLLSY